MVVLLGVVAELDVIGGGDVSSDVEDVEGRRRALLPVRMVVEGRLCSVGIKAEAWEESN